MSDSKILGLWTELCQQVAELQKDVEKNAVKNNVSAGVRVRKGLRALKKQAALILKETLISDKEIVESRKTESKTSE